MKEKYDLSLDNRQVMSLLIGALVVLGAVFVLGVVVGKKLAGNQEAAQEPNLLAALDAQAEAHARVQAQAAELTFPDELTRKTTGNPPAGEPAARPPVVTIDVPVVKPSEPAKAEPAAADAAPADDEKEEKEAVAEASAAPARSAAAKEEKPAVAAKAAPRVEQKPAVAEAPRKAAPVPTRIVVASGTRPQTASRVAVPTGTSANGTFSLQLSASQNRDEADRFAQRLRERGYAPYIVPAEVPGKGTWYRVRMGRFPTKEAAARYLADFKRETRMDAFIAGTN